MWPFRKRDEVKVVGRATKFKPCRPCGKRNCQTPNGRGETITRGGWYVVRQYFTCQNCGVKSLWHRRLDLDVWTLDRSGM